jgi:hypothetical protein
MDMEAADVDGYVEESHVNSQVDSSPFFYDDDDVAPEEEEKFEEDLILPDVEEVDAVDDVRVNAPAEYKTNCIHLICCLACQGIRESMKTQDRYAMALQEFREVLRCGFSDFFLTLRLTLHFTPHFTLRSASAFFGQLLTIGEE